MASKGNDEGNKGRTALEMREVLQTLFLAAMTGEVAKIEEVLAKEKTKHPEMSTAEMLSHYKDANGRTAVHFAGHSAQAEALKYLLDIAPEAVAWEDEKGDTPLTLAVAAGAGRLPVVNLLIERGAKVNAGRFAKALHHAAGHEDVEVVKRLLEEGADMTAQSQTGTALHWAAGHGAQEVLQVLITAGSDVNAKNAQGMTAIMLAAANGCGKCVTVLAKAGADVSLILSGDLTALHMIAEFGSAEAVQAILDTEQGRKCALHESDNGKPIHLAAWGGHRDIVELLWPYSEVNESIEDLMEWGAARAAEYAAHEAAMEPAAAAGGTPPHEPPAASSPEDVDKALKIKDEANRCFIGKDYTKALELYTQAIALNGRDAVFWSNRAGCYMQLGKYEEALKDGEMAKALKPDWSKARYRCAEAQLALARYEDAALSAHEGIQMDGANEALHKLLREAIDLGRKEHQAKLAAAAAAANNSAVEPSVVSS